MSDNLAKQLYQASLNGHDREVLELLQRGAPPNSDYYTRECSGHTPLHEACHLRCANILIKFGAIVAATDNGGYTSLHLACAYNRKAIAKLLLEHHCPVDIKHKFGGTAADVARRHGYPALAEYVERFQPGLRDPLSSYPTLEQLSQLECDQWLQLGIRLGLGSVQLKTIKKSQHPTAATLQAAKIKNIDIQWKDIVKALVIIGEDESALSVSAFYGWLDCVKHLVETVDGLDPKGTVNKAGDTPLSLACANGHLDTVKYLVNEHHCYPKRSVNKAGDDTPLSLAYKSGHWEVVKYLVITHHCDTKMAVNKAGDTPLSSAFSHGNLEMVKALMNKHVDPNKPVNKAGDTPLSLACANGHLDIIKYLVNQHYCDPKSTVNKVGDTPLSLAYMGGHLETIKYFTEEHQCDPKFAVNEAGDTPLSLECSHGNLEMVNALINKHVDPNKPVNKAGDTPLSLAYKGGHLEVVKYLAITHHCDTTSVFFLAVKHNWNALVEVLLVETHSDPNVTDKEGKTPLDLTNNPEIIKLLLKHGAKAANVYKKHSKLIGKLSSERPPHLPLSVFIIGDGGVGKSTLLKSILSSKGLWSKLQKAKHVDGVDTKTVGIIPYEIYTKKFGRIIYFDFAGQKEFYTSHCAILENAVQTSPPIIILCAKLVESEQAIIDSTYRWLTLVQNQCTNLKGKAHVIVVGSHADEVKEMGKDPQAKESIFAPIIKQFPKFEFKEFIPMDCRFADSNDITKARKQILKSSAVLRSPETISLNAHTFYIYLAENFKDNLAVSLKVVQQRIHSDLDQTHESEKMMDILSFIPTTLNRLADICDQLSKVGLLLFLHNKSSPEKSFLICDSKQLLSDVTGTVFAPETFCQHCDLASSTGVVPLSKFKKAFSNYDIEMLIAFMTHLELCFEIKDKQVLEYIHKMEPDLDDTRYLFFPGLIKIETPKSVWEEDPSMSYHFGWIIECAQDIQFFDPRSFHILILRLVFTFCLAPSKKINTKNPALQKFCSVWKSGICWCNDDGITAHLELSNNKSITLKIRSEVLKPESLAHRSKTVKKVLETVKDVCPNILVVESLINPQEVVSHPLKPSSELTLFSVRDLAVAVISQKEAVKSVHRALSLRRLLQFEPYAGLDLNTLHCIHSDKNVGKYGRISNIFISHFVRQISDPNNILMYRRILSQSRALVVNIQSVSPRQEVVQALMTWRSETEGTYSCLRETLNEYSVFIGRNPLDLAGVAHDDIDLSMFSISGDEQIDHDTSREEHWIPSIYTSGQPANRVMLQELIKRYNLTDEQLDSEIEDSNTPKLALCFDNVELYSSSMGLAIAKQADVKQSCRTDGTQAAMMECLQIWKEHNPFQATYRALLNIVLGLEKGDTAHQICQQLTQ